MIWQTARYRIDLAEPRVMGIVNVTPDSFSDGGRHAGTAAALRHCEALVRDGADILDIGGESSRPGAAALPVAQELARVLPVVRDAVRLGVPVSVDTYKPTVMRAALDEGADIVNDIWALRWSDAAAGEAPDAAQAVIAAHPACGVCLMHMHGEPATMQRQPMVGEGVGVARKVTAFLADAARRLRGHGVAAERIVLDPGIGFGKTVAQNFALLAHQHLLLSTGHPVVAAWSRKSSLAAVAGIASQADAAPHDRLAPGIAAAVLAVERGARVVRVHDVRETLAALAVWRAARFLPSSHTQERDTT